MQNTVVTPVSAQLLLANATALVTATPKTITSIFLNAGTWLVTGSVAFISAATTVQTSALVGFNTTTNVLPSIDQGLAQINQSQTASTTNTLDGNDFLINVGQNGATIFLVAQAGFTTSTMTAAGQITAYQVAA